MRSLILLFIAAVVLGRAAAGDDASPTDKQPRHRILSVQASTTVEAVAKGVTLRGQSRRVAPPPVPLTGAVGADGRIHLRHRRLAAPAEPIEEPDSRNPPSPESPE
jgi:hypothetical protein